MREKCNVLNGFDNVIAVYVIILDNRLSVSTEFSEFPRSTISGDRTLVKSISSSSDFFKTSKKNARIVRAGLAFICRPSLLSFAALVWHTFVTIFGRQKFERK